MATGWRRDAPGLWALRSDTRLVGIAYQIGVGKKAVWKAKWMSPRARTLWSNLHRKKTCLNLCEARRWVVEQEKHGTGCNRPRAAE